MIARPHWFSAHRLPFSENSLLLGLAILVGLLTGVCVWLYREGFHWVHRILVEGLADASIGAWLAQRGVDGRLGGVVVLAIVGAVVGWLMYRFVGHEDYHGVSGIMASVALTGGRLPYWKMPFKAVASALSLGAGASTGPEDPSVQIGSNLGSFIGQKLHLSEERVRLLVPAGAASAIAAAFNAPIAGVFFALEVILGEFTSNSFGIVVLAAVISSAFTQAVRGATPVFDGLSYQLGNPLELPFYILLGFGLSLASLVTIRYLSWQTGAWGRWLAVRPPLRAALTGALVGMVGVFVPQILGTGEDVMHHVLIGDSDYAIHFLAFLALLKLVMTAISLGGGFVGGVFAPTLFIGIMLGGAYGGILHGLFPNFIDDPNTYAIAGMAGLLAGVMRSPITAIMLVFELTDEYLLILPIMLTSVICVYFLERRGQVGFYALALLKHGLRLEQGRDVDLMQGITVGEAMTTPAPKIAPTASLTEMRDALRRLHTRSLCVVDEDQRLYGMVTLSDLQRAYEQISSNGGAASSLTVGDICARDVVSVTPDDGLWSAIRLMGAHDVGRLPVVGRDGKVLGILGRNHIVDAYNKAVARKLQDQHYAEQIRLNTLTGAHVIECYVRPGCPLVGAYIRDIHWPPEAVVASIRRANKLIVPHGNTALRSGDILTIVTDPLSERQLKALFEVNQSL